MAMAREGKKAREGTILTCLFIHVLSHFFVPLSCMYTVQMQIFGPVYAPNTYSIDVHIFIVLSICVVENAYAEHFDMDSSTRRFDRFLFADFFFFM
jgi:hypothetical protein